MPAVRTRALSRAAGGRYRHRLYRGTQLGRLGHGPLFLALGILRRCAARGPGHSGCLFHASRLSLAPGAPLDRLGRHLDAMRLVDTVAARLDLGRAEQLVGDAYTGPSDRLCRIAGRVPAGRKTRWRTATRAESVPSPGHCFDVR